MNSTSNSLFRERDAQSSGRRFTSRHVRVRACPRSNRIQPTANIANCFAPMVKKLKRVEIAYLAAFHRLTSNVLLLLKNNVYNLAFNGWQIQGESKMLWARMVTYVTGMVNQELLLRNEYLGAENRILRGQIKGRLLLSEGEKATLAEIAQRLGRKALEELAAVAKPDTLLAWYRKLIAKKFDGSKFRQRVGRPRIDEEAERLVVQVAEANAGGGDDRIVGALANLGFLLSDLTVGNILRRHGLSPAPKRKQAISWKDFIRSHMGVLVGTDLFTAEVLTLKGLVTYYVQFFIHLESRRVSLPRMTPSPGPGWKEKQARNATIEEWGFLRG